MKGVLTSKQRPWDRALTSGTPVYNDALNEILVLDTIMSKYCSY